MLFLAGLEIEFEKLRGRVLQLTALGFGFFIPVFFVTSGVRFDLDALVGSGRTLRWCRCS